MRTWRPSGWCTSPVVGTPTATGRQTFFVGATRSDEEPVRSFFQGPTAPNRTRNPFGKGDRESFNLQQGRGGLVFYFGSREHADGELEAGSFPITFSRMSAYGLCAGRWLVTPVAARREIHSFFR